MNIQKYNGAVSLLLAFMVSISTFAFAAPRSEYTKSIKREFSTTKNGQVDLSNKYGKVRIETWNENKVKIEVTIIVNANSEAEAEEGFDRISINFMNTVGLVKAETVLGETKKSKSWWNPVAWATSYNSCEDFRINYLVYMPESNDLVLSNKYGDSYLTKLEGRLNASIKYGDLDVQDIRSSTDLSIAYGEADFERADDIKADVSYGELNIEFAHDIDLRVKYSEVEIEEAGLLKIHTRYDDFKFGKIREIRMNAAYTDGRIKGVGILNIESDYTDIKIDYVAQKIDADLDYSSIRIGSLARDFASINVDGDYSDLVIEPESNTGFSFDFKGSYCGFRINPDASYSQKEKNSGKKRYIGKVGNGGGTVKARMRYGDFIVR